MNTRRFCRFAGCLFALTLAWLLAGCATTQNNSKEAWDRRVGHYTVKQAVADLGRPQRATQLDHGMQLGEWVTKVGTRTGMQSHFGPTYTARAFDYSWLPRDAPMIPDQYLRLMFNRQGTLVAWDRHYE